MKIHVIGSCQAIPLADCLAAMVPSARVELYVLRDDPGFVRADGDVVFRQRNRRAVWTPHELPSGEFLFPRIWYNAFHPDVVYTAGASAVVVPPLAADHSSLALYGWNRGLSVAQTEQLFCEAVFEHLNFFGYADAARRALLEEGRAAGFPLDALLDRWEQRGRFMHTPNHPALFVMADLARALAERAGLTVEFDAPELYLNDPMLEKAVWPVYPEIARRLGVRGDYTFKAFRWRASDRAPLLLSLREFIERAFAVYALMTPAALACTRLESPVYRDLERIAASARGSSRNGASAPATARTREGSPYADLPAASFWRRAVERVPAADVDPVGAPRFTIDRRARIATVGSCFAQHMSRVLVRNGYNYYVAEAAPEGLGAEEARRAGYGVFSVRCGNVYTARQLLQLFERAFGTFVPREDAWLRPDGRWADPFRPQIVPDGFATAEALRDARARHLAAVRTMFERLEVLIVTLGLTEAWRSRDDGAVFPLAPGVSAGRMDHARYEFVNFTTADVRDDMDAFLARLAGVNPGAKVVLTVSPQPPIATYEPRHVLVSATYTKAALRAAADEVERAHPQVWYFPGYELVAGAFNRGAYYAGDLRTVTPEGVDHVMRLFLAHCAPDEPRFAAPAAASSEEDRLLEENRAGMDVVCDEEVIAYGEATAPAAGDAAQRSEYSVFLDRDAAPYGQSHAAPTSTAPMEALPPASMRARIDAVLPSAMQARGLVNVPCVVRNDGDVALASGGPHPVYLCYRWYDERGEPAEAGEWIHTPLPETLEPNASVSVQMPIAAPRFAARYRLCVTLLQSEVAWFDDVDPSNGIVADVEVTSAVTAGTRAR